MKHEDHEEFLAALIDSQCHICFSKCSYSRIAGRKIRFIFRTALLSPYYMLGHPAAHL